MDTVLSVNPDLILLDLKMDGLNGFQATDRLRQNALLKNIPIVAMTGHFTDNIHIPLINSCSIDYCLIKPFDYFDVIAKIETALAEVKADKVKIRQKKGGKNA